MPTEPCRSLAAFAIPAFPIVKQGDDLASLIVESTVRAGISLQTGDVVVLAQKVVSKAEGRYLDLRSLKPSPRALELAARTGKDPQLVEAILRESTEIVGAGPNIIIAAHHCGVVLANAGIDRSNVGDSADDSVVLLLPQEPDRTCREIRQGLLDRLGIDLAVVINDSLGRPWRQGTVGTAIGASGVPALLDLRGRPDLFGRMLMVSQEAIADEIAATAQLIQGQADEGQPVVVVRGRFNWGAPDRGAASLLRPKSDDLFR